MKAIALREFGQERSVLGKIILDPTLG